MQDDNASNEKWLSSSAMVLIWHSLQQRNVVIKTIMTLRVNEELNTLLLNTCTS